MAGNDSNKGKTGSRKRAREIDFSLVTKDTLPTFSQRELREIAKHFGIKIPRAFHSQPTICDYLSKVFENDPLILKEKLREDKTLTAEQWGHCSQLCNMLSTHQEIANFFHMTVEQLQKACYTEYGISFMDYYQRESTNGKISLRRAQMQSALGAKAIVNQQGVVLKSEIKPSIPMQIYLGKVLLGQVEPKDTGKQSDEGAITLDKLTEILLEEKGEDVLAGGEQFDRAYKVAKVGDNQRVGRGANRNGGNENNG